jgi:DNA-binding transcriptional MerR regulator
VPFHTPRQAADDSGFSLDTLRYYERIGLLPAIRRTPAGRRTFTDTDLKWLGLLRCLRDTGMPISEMLRFVQLLRDGDATVPERIAVLDSHQRRVRDRITRLEHHLGQLDAKLAHYRAGPVWRPEP